VTADSELRNLVDEYLYLVEVGSSSTDADESELAHLLDRLALAMRTLVLPAEPDEQPEVPVRNVDVLRKVASSRFPNYANGAIEEIAAIADHLHAVAWLWRSATPDAGLWYLAESYRTAWGHPMRALQLYLHDRE
jgi:hypothetical protein